MFVDPFLVFRYLNSIFPFVAPYLLPTLNTLMTCSVYATVAVAFDRYVEMTDGLSTYKWLKNGIVQCLIILVFSIIFNITRWFELEHVNYFKMENATNILANDTEEIMEKNVSKVSLQVTRPKFYTFAIRYADVESHEY